jgi:hypothetical protein
VFTTLELKFHLVLEPHGILLEMQSSPDRRCADHENKVSIPDRLIENICISVFCDAVFSSIKFN